MIFGRGDQERSCSSSFELILGLKQNNCVSESRVSELIFIKIVVLMVCFLLKQICLFIISLSFMAVPANS